MGRLYGKTRKKPKMPYDNASNEKKDSIQFHST